MQRRVYSKPGLLIMLMLATCVAAFAQRNPDPDNKMMVRISEIEIFPANLAEYNKILKEEAAASVKKEPGVIAIFPMYQQQDSTQVRIIEIYADRTAYESHLKTPHFQHYKTSTIKMVKSLKLIDMVSLDREMMPMIFKKLQK